MTDRFKLWTQTNQLHGPERVGGQVVNRWGGDPKPVWLELIRRRGNPFDVWNETTVCLTSDGLVCTVMGEKWFAGGQFERMRSQS